jgi:hypothetical protein
MGIFAQPLSSDVGHEGGHLKYRIIPSKVGKRIWGNDFMRCSLGCLERREERQQGSIRSEALPSLLNGVEFFERLLLHRQISLDTHMSRFDTFVTEP